MLYHYTDKTSAAEIIRDGVIRAYPTTLYLSMFGDGESIDTPPVVWLTKSATLDGTVAVKLRCAGWSAEDVRRIAVEVSDAMDIAEFIKQSQIKKDWFMWSLITARLAGSDARDWRIVTRDVTEIV